MIDILRDRPSDATPTGEQKPDVVVLLDESGSMFPQQQSVVDTFNEFVQSVRYTANSVSLYTFDSTGIREKFFRKHPHRVKKLSVKDYIPNALTPLYDAMGKLIMEFSDNERPVQFVTHTDGAENDSKEFRNFAKLDELMKIKEKNDNWLFVHLGEGVEGRNEVQKFTGLKMQFSPQNRGETMRSLGQTTALYAATASNDLGTYTKNANGTLDIDKGEGGEIDLNVAVHANVQAAKRNPDLGQNAGGLTRKTSRKSTEALGASHPGPLCYHNHTEAERYQCV